MSHHKTDQNSVFRIVHHMFNSVPQMPCCHLIISPMRPKPIVTMVTPACSRLQSPALTQPPLMPCMDSRATSSSRR